MAEVLSGEPPSDVPEASPTLDGGPGLVFMPFVVMEDLLDKLKLLNYEEDFVKDLRLRPLHRHYFVLQTNPGEQFYLFTCLSAWLIKKAGIQPGMDQPQEFDDPNATIANILDCVRRIGVTVDFAPSKLKQGYGEQAIFVLDRLSDAAMRACQFQWDKPVVPHEEDYQGGEEEEDEAELNLDRVEEEMAAEYSEEEDEDDILHINDLSAGVMGGAGSTAAAAAAAAASATSQRPEEILSSTTDAEEWRLEVEKVAPQLKVTVRVDNRDWRAHLEQMHDYRKGIDEALNVTRLQLDKLHSDIARTLEKIGSRERYLNAQLEGPLQDFRHLTDSLAATKEQYKQVSGGVTERSRTLSQIADDLEVIKSEMEERGSSMTDGTPLVNVRRALARMKQELMSMNVRMGVVEHSVMQAKLKDKSDMQREALNFNAASEAGGGGYF